MHTFVTRLLGFAQEIISATSSPLHVQRWTVFRSKFFDVCLDHCAGQHEESDRCTELDCFVSVGPGKVHSTEDAPMIASFDDKACMVLFRRHYMSVR